MILSQCIANKLYFFLDQCYISAKNLHSVCKWLDFNFWISIKLQIIHIKQINILLAFLLFNSPKEGTLSPWWGLLYLIWLKEFLQTAALKPPAIILYEEKQFVFKFPVLNWFLVSVCPYQKIIFIYSYFFKGIDNLSCHVQN